MKLNVLLAKTDHLASLWTAALIDYAHFFRNKQEAFKGEKKTYVPAIGTIDLPSERNNKLVSTTVEEKIDWLVKGNEEYLNALFSQERTNSSGSARAELIVAGSTIGEFTSLELLRMKSLLESSQLQDVLANIPVRSDTEEWEKSEHEEHKNRAIFKSPQGRGTKKSTLKESYILTDPNLSKGADPAKYTPVVAQKDTIIDLGDYTFQKFSGEWSHRERAEVLKNKSIFLGAVIEALKKANEAEVVESKMTAMTFFTLIFAKS